MVAGTHAHHLLFTMDILSHLLQQFLLLKYFKRKAAVGHLTPKSFGMPSLGIFSAASQ